MVSSRQIFSCTILSVSSVFVSVACALSLCSKAWSIFQENVIPVLGLFIRSHLHQRSETSSPRCYKSARVHAQQHHCEYSGDICYAEQANSSANTAGSTVLLSASSPNYPNSVSQYARLSCMVMSQQRSGLSDGLVLPQSMPPAALTRPDQSPANNRVYIVALTSSFLYLTGSERWDLRCENRHVESYPAENRAILLETTESLMFSTLALLWWYRGSYLMICISLSG